MTEAVGTVPARATQPLWRFSFSGSMLRPLLAVLPPVAFLAGLVALWALLSAYGLIPAFVLPGPAAVGEVFVTQGHVLLRHAIATGSEALSGFVIGNIAAVLAACLLGFSQPLKDMFYPYALASRAIPIIVFTPVFVVVLGRGIAPIIGIVSFSVYFPTFLNMIRGLKSADADYYEMLHTFSASPLQRLRMIEFPAAMPYLFAALKVSASSAFISALVSEWIGANAGLGYLVVVSGQYFRLPLMWAAIFTAAAMTLTLLGLVHLAEHRLSRYTAHAPEMGQ
ncbi:putative aliphatic sulfonates transport permease protein SsuC [Hartmannibacter diazotrophicus]|uniref:Putative aliphatic sulfonates transport permease protein SsuC n=1 Tax=Hartmannibacter diazotrophicus TaxID=1482074 RepID=A0A2C9D156_9HYPH|nr:ABC transporter permease [Hartmannibacter diazotrophicus]SON53919.1 putative aliphatic sulfonates transport permease protein SsuC [Hartmannibacter diazotrophicus]